MVDGPPDATPAALLAATLASEHHCITLIPTERRITMADAEATKVSEPIFGGVYFAVIKEGSIDNESAAYVR